ncbi:MAG: hypothetical protein M3Q75_08765 [Gemmatimonadota bacterium]|nr:hypothetical protein [Gemmatimonadota bacterium]
MRSLPLLVCLTLATAACQPATTRPAFGPLPEAPGSEVRLVVPEATRRLAEALRADSIPTHTVRLRDGYIETPWFLARTRRPTTQRPLGPTVVRIRAWADPARPGSSQLRVETLYRPRADPSLPERELEREVPRDHPVAVRVKAVLKRLVERFGTPPPPPPQVQQPAAPPDDGDE